jgi:hypothetical protein
MSSISFKPKQVTKKLLGALSPRAGDVLLKRYGLGTDAEQHTLEAIGQLYGITRERVRQIENHAIHSIQKSEAYKEFQHAFRELEEALEELGVVVAEHELLDTLSKDTSTKNHLYFLLVLGTPFNREKEDDRFHHRWHVESAVARKIEKALEEMHAAIGEEDLLSEEDMLALFREKLDDGIARGRDTDTIRRWLSLSKVVARNPLGEWGSSASSNVRAKGIRDFAYLAVKRHGSPMHFREVAKAIENLFDRSAHVATCHNELIKDKRFVLVGRGLYALSEWGYSAGVVKDVLRDILKKEGALTRNEIIDKVRKERYVKDNTIIVNLQDTALFRRLPDGKYTLAE